MKKKNLLLYVFLTSLLCISSLQAQSFLDEAYKTSPLKKKNSKNYAHELQKTYNTLYTMYKDSVVFINTEKTVKMRHQSPFMDDPFFKDFFGKRYKQRAPQKRKQKGMGTGFIISSDGYICTNHHVVANMDSIMVAVSDKEYNATLIGSDPLTDIALLKIQSGKKFKAVHFGDSDDVNIGDMVIAIGNPFGLDKTITSGIVSATARKTLDQTGNSHIQTDASINPGNSGGPLINLDGEVIGVNRMIFSRTGGNLGIGFAIPINRVKDTLIQLKKYKKVRRGYIGVQIAPISKALANKLGLDNTEGCLIGALERGGPAEKGGLRPKDVILNVDGKKIKDFTDLLRAISKIPIGETVKISVWRNKKRTNFWITVKERP